MYAILFLLSLLLAAPAAAQTDPRTLPLVQASDLTYVGAFLLPRDDGRGVEFYDAQFGLGVSADGGTLYLTCVRGTTVAAVTIPAVGQTARVLTPCTSVGVSQVAADGVVGGILDVNGRLTVSGWSYYDAAAVATKTHATGAGLATLGAWQGRSGARPGFVGGYMGTVPAEWRGLFGGPALTGLCCVPIIGRSSWGPAVNVFDPAGTTVTPLLGYDAAHPLGPAQGVSALWNRATSIYGVAFPGGSRSVLFIGRQPTTYCYGDKSTGCTDPTSNDKGEHGWPYNHQVWAYDAADLLAVKQGAAVYTPRPYATWTLPDVHPANGDRLPIGATWHEPTRTLYVIEQPRSNQGRVHLYRVGAGAPPPPPPPAEVCGNGKDDDGDGQIDEGCTPPPPPPVDVCTAAPIVITGVAWPGGTEGSRSGRFTWDVAGASPLLASARFVFVNGLAVRLELTDSRGCAAEVRR